MAGHRTWIRIYPRSDSRSCRWKTHPASLRRGADLKTFPEGDLLKRQRGGDLRAAPTVYGATFSAMDPLQATIEDFAAEGYTHIESSCPRCRVIRLRPMLCLV